MWSACSSSIRSESLQPISAAFDAAYTAIRGFDERAGRRGDVHDARGPVGVRDHAGDELARDVHGRERVDLHGGAGVLAVVGLPEVPVAAHDAGVVDEHVGVADLAAHALGGLRDRAEVGHIHDVGLHAGATLRDGADLVDGAGERRAVDVPQRDGCRVLGDGPLRVHAAHAAGRARDEHLRTLHRSRHRSIFAHARRGSSRADRPQAPFASPVDAARRRTISAAILVMRSYGTGFAYGKLTESFFDRYGATSASSSPSNPGTG